MKLFSLSLCLMILVACHQEQHQQRNNNTPQFNLFPVTAKPIGAATKKDSSSEEQVTDEQTLPYYVVIADTGISYDLLHQKMVMVNKALNIPIDTLGRYYDRKKDLIVLPDNDPDEIYAGDYFPRRDASESLSLEYLNFYKRSSRKRTIALVAGIFEKKNSADSAFAFIKKYSDKGWVLYTKIYQGCIH